jgi:hypothetical protein
MRTQTRAAKDLETKGITCSERTRKLGIISRRIAPKIITTLQIHTISIRTVHTKWVHFQVCKVFLAEMT